MKVTTKVGDKGTTQVGPGEFVSKSDERVEFFGTIDELQVVIGGIFLEKKDSDDKENSDDKEDKVISNYQINEYLVDIQRKLFDIYSGKISKEDVENLEKYQKKLQDDPKITFDWNLTTPQTFNIDLARVTARKLERQFYRCDFENDNENLKLFLNRLSDFLWVVGRHICSKPK